jgi:carbonic anhydrase
MTPRAGGAGDVRIEAILEHNRAGAGRRPAGLFPEAPTLTLAVVACYDPRLDPLLPDVLGLRPADAFLLRAAGALLRPDSASLRSLAMSVFMFGVSEVLVVGHAACRMAAFSAAGFTQAFRSRRVPRDAFGDADLREWAGAIASPRDGVHQSLDAIASAAYMPADLTVAGVVLDESTGQLEIVTGPVTLAARRGARAPAPEAEPAPAPEAPTAPPEPPAEDDALPRREIDDLRAFVQILEGTAGWGDELRRVRERMTRQEGLSGRISVLESFLRRATTNAREVAAAYERLKGAATRGDGFDLGQLLRIFESSERRPRR